MIYPAKFRQRKLLLSQQAVLLTEPDWWAHPSCPLQSTVTEDNKSLERWAHWKCLQDLGWLRKLKSTHRKLKSPELEPLWHQKSPHKITGAQRKGIHLQEGKDGKVYMEYLWPKNIIQGKLNYEIQLTGLFYNFWFLFFFIHITPVQTDWR